MTKFPTLPSGIGVPVNFSPDRGSDYCVFQPRDPPPPAQPQEKLLGSVLFFPPRTFVPSFGGFFKKYSLIPSVPTGPFARWAPFPRYEIGAHLFAPRCFRFFKVAICFSPFKRSGFLMAHQWSF